MSDANGDTPYDIHKILKALPHRYPLLLVDRVRSIELGDRIHAVKAVSFNEEFFQGHFPGAPIMPGVLQIEALAQAAAILGVETLELAGTGKLVFLHITGRPRMGFSIITKQANVIGNHRSSFICPQTGAVCMRILKPITPHFIRH